MNDYFERVEKLLNLFPDDCTRNEITERLADAMLDVEETTWNEAILTLRQCLAAFVNRRIEHKKGQQQWYVRHVSGKGGVYRVSDESMQEIGTTPWKCFYTCFDDSQAISLPKADYRLTLSIVK